MTPVSRGGLSRCGLVRPDLSFCVVLGIFPDLVGDSPDLSFFRSFLFFGLLRSGLQGNSRNGPGHNQELPEKNWEAPRFVSSEELQNKSSRIFEF